MRISCFCASSTDDSSWSNWRMRLLAVLRGFILMKQQVIHMFWCWCSSLHREHRYTCPLYTKGLFSHVWQQQITKFTDSSPIGHFCHSEAANQLPCICLFKYDFRNKVYQNITMLLFNSTRISLVILKQYTSKQNTRPSRMSHDAYAHVS